MKTPAIIVAAILSFMLHSKCFAQLVAEAGNDTAVCADSPSTLAIGGTPTASGGIPPYQYAWSGSFEHSGRIYSASSMLEDTTVSNPTFIEGAIPDSVVLIVSVTDVNDSTAIDSIRIRKSSYIVCTGDCILVVNPGDSVQLTHCVSGGIPPLTFLWTPSESLSDSTISKPWAKPTANTHYTLQIIDSIGCQATSNCEVFINTSNDPNHLQNQSILVYPNPAEEYITIQFNNHEFSNSTFEIITLTGKIISTLQVNTTTLNISTHGIEPGIYIYLWKSDKKSMDIGKIIIE